MYTYISLGLIELVCGQSLTHPFLQAFTEHGLFLQTTYILWSRTIVFFTDGI